MEHYHIKFAVGDPDLELRWREGGRGGGLDLLHLLIRHWFVEKLHHLKRHERKSFISLFSQS